LTLPTLSCHTPFIGDTRTLIPWLRVRHPVGGPNSSGFPLSLTGELMEEFVVPVSIPIISTLQLQQESKWEKVSQHITSHFHAPDLEALRCVLAACHAQYFPGDPVWLFVIGPSGSGKTSIVVNCAATLTNVFVESSVTSKSLLSGAKDGHKSSLLQLIGSSGTLVFKDFTTILSKKDDEQREIVSQFREVYDGRYSIRTGQRSAIWTGKVTVIAAVTPAIERAWAVHRDLGERFLQVRWAGNDSLRIAESARSQRGKELSITKDMQILVKDFFTTTTTIPEVSTEQGHLIDVIATIVARMRGNVIRDKDRARTIIEVSLPEEPTRIAKGMEALATHHAALFSRSVGPEDFAIAARVGFDSAPARKMKIMRAIPEDGIPVLELASKVCIPEATLRYTLMELESLELTSAVEVGAFREIHIHPKTKPLWKEASATIPCGVGVQER